MTDHRFILSERQAIRDYDGRGRPRFERLDRALAQLMPERSRSELQRWIEEQRVQLNGKVCRAKDGVKPGDTIELSLGPPQLSEATPDPSVLVDIVYQDPHLLVVNKPAGLVVHPGAGHPRGTLVNGLLALPGFEYLPTDTRDPAGFLRPGIVHRLDKQTSGLLVVARDAVTREGLKEQFAAHSIRREYLALTYGVPEPGRIETTHARHPMQRKKFTSTLAEGKLAITSVEVLEAFRQMALISCRLETGRTHQIRVHLAEQRRAPILGDELYGWMPPDEQLRSVARAIGRQALHAIELGFSHPQTGEELLFRSELPADFQAGLSLLRGEAAS